MPQLNVILHGLFALVEGEGRIIALAPRVNGQHVYRAGRWLGEVELRSGFYILTGVQSGDAVFKDGQNLIVPGKTMCPGAPCMAHATILLPQPKEIYSVRRIDVMPQAFTGGDAPTKTVNMATIQILVYDCAHLTDVQLSGHAIQIPKDPDLSIFNLHLYSEEDVDPTDLDHSTSAFEEAVKLFKNVDLHLKDRHPIPPPSPGEVLPEGVLPLELECLGHRQDRMALLGQILRLILASSPHDYSTLKAVFEAGFAVGGELQSCSFPIVRGTS